MAFWDTWETWAKMTFILACSIGVVLIISIGIRWRNKTNIKRHSKRMNAGQAERGEMEQTVQQEDEVPFGIRAIERGREVDGVWNSKTNTPLQSPGNSVPGSPVTRPKDLGNGLLALQRHRRELSSSTISNIEIPKPALSRTDPKALPDSSTDTTSEAKTSSERENAGESSPERQSMRGRRAYQPRSLSGNISYPPSAYPANSSRCRSYPSGAYQPPGGSKHRSYPSSASQTSTLEAEK